MKSFHALLALLVCASPLVGRASQTEEVAAYAVADATTGYLLDSAHPRKKLQIGSLTKIATAMVVLDWADVSHQDLGALATVPAGIGNVGGANPVGFQAGDQVSLRDLLYAALLQSDNVAAFTLAYHVGKLLPRVRIDATPEEMFVAQMNALARKLGMERTKFLNPHGLDNIERPYSTAEDLVRLTSYAMKRSAFRFYVSQKERQITRITSGGEAAQYNLINTNELLGADGIDGVKTGKTGRAGECVIISAAKAPESTTNPDKSVTVTPRRLIVVALGANSRFDVAKQILDRGWNLYDTWAAQGRPLKK